MKLQRLLWLPFSLALAGSLSVQSALQAQTPPITAAPDGTGTVVTPNASTFAITGGATSANGANLFHSFGSFNLPTGQVADFQAAAAIQNILGRVTGGGASFIDGLLRVSGANANLFLLNPAGILFGPNASLNVPAAFTATTANAIGFGSKWFNASGPNDYAALNGTPGVLAFTAGQPGAVVNAGSLSVGPGQQLSLIGGTVASTGSLAGGQVTVAAVPGGHYVRLGQPGNVLGIEVPVGGGELPTNWNLPILSLPELLTGGGDTRLDVGNDGGVRLAGSTLAVVPGDAAVREVRAESAGLFASNNLTLRESQLHTAKDLTLEAGGTVTVRDTPSGAVNVRADGALTIQGNRGIDILALDHPETPFVSGGQLTLRSDGIVSGDTHFSSGGGFTIETLSGKPGTFVSKYDPVISSTGDVSFGDYTGVSLKVESAGSISGGNIVITGNETAANLTTANLNDPDIQILIASPALILRAGTTLLNTVSGGNIAAILPGGNATFEGTTFDASTATSSPATITLTGPVLTQAPGLRVILSAPGDVSTQGIDTDGGDIDITSSTGSITANPDSQTGVDTSFGSSNAGNITLTAEDGSVTTGTLGAASSSGDGGELADAGNGGNVNIIAGTGISITDIFTVSIGNVSTSGVGGAVSLSTASGNIVLRDINTRSVAFSSSSNAGDITLIAGNGSVTTNSLVANSQGGELAETGNGGNVNITAGTGISTAEINPGSGGNVSISGEGGAVSLTTTSGDILLSDINADTFAVSSSGNAGNITLIAENGNIITDVLSAVSQGDGNVGNGGSVNITAGTGISITNINTGSGDNANNSGVGGAVSLSTVSGNIVLDNINTASIAFSSSSNAGDITLIAGNGSVTTISLGATSSDDGGELGDTGNGGNVNITAGTGIFTADINTFSGGNVGSSGVGGTVSLSTTSGSILLSNVNTRSAALSSSGTAGNITLIAENGNIATGFLRATSDGGGGLADTGNGGSVNITAGTGIFTTDISTFSGGNASNSSAGGTVSLETASGDILLNAIDTSSRAFSGDDTVVSAGPGGSIVLTANTGGITVGAIDSASTLDGNTTDAGSGNITVTANQISLTGNSASVNGPGADILLQPSSVGQAVVVGGLGGNVAGTLFIDDAELAALNTGFNQITIGRADGTGQLSLGNSVTFRDPVVLRAGQPGGAAGTIDTTAFSLAGLGSLTLQAGGDITTGVAQTNVTSPQAGGITVATSGLITLNGNVSATSASSTINIAGGNITFTGNVRLRTGVTIDSSGIAPFGNTGIPIGGDIIFTGTVDGTTANTNFLTLNAGTGNVAFNSLVGSTVPVGSLTANSGGTTRFASSVNAATLTTDAPGSAQLNGNVTTDGSQAYNDSLVLETSPVLSSATGNIAFGSLVNTASANLGLTAVAADSITLGGTFTTSGGLISFTTGSFASGNASTINSGGGNITVAANAITFGAPVTSGVANVGTLTLQPQSSANPIGIAVPEGTLQLTADSLAQLQNGFQLITIGSTTQTGNISTGIVAFQDPLLLQAPGGSVFVNGTLTGLDNASITILSSDSTTVLNADIITTGNPITLGNNVLLGNTVTLDTTSGGTVTTGANIALSSNLDAGTPSGQGLTLQAGTTGAASIAGSVGAVNPLANLSIAAGAPLVQGAAWRVTGTTSLAVGTASDITLTNAANDFGTVAVASANNVSITDLNALNFGNTAVSGALSVSAGGQISQSVETGIAVAGNATFATSLGEAGTVSLTNSAAAGTILGNSVIGGNFALTSAGNVSQVPDSTLKVAGQLTVEAPGSVSITNSGNVLSDSVSTNGDVTITRVGLITLPARTVSGNLIVESLASGEQFATVLGNSAILLDSATNSFGGAVGLSTANTLANISAAPGINQSGTLIVAGQAFFDATATGDITLLDAANQFGSLGFTGNNVSIAQQNAIALLSSAAAGNLLLQSGSAIAQSDSLTVTVGGSASFTGADVFLDSEANALSGAVVFTSSGSTVFVNSTDTQLGSASVGGNLQVRSGSGLNLTGPLAASGVVLTGNSITSNSAGTVSAGSGNVTFTADAIALGAPVSSGGTLLLQPLDPAVSIGIAGGVGTLQLTADSLAQLQNGFSSIVIGSAAQTGDISTGTVAFQDPVSFQTPGGSLFVNGTLTGLDNASIELVSSANTTVLNANIVTAGNPIFFRSNVLLGNTVTLDTTNSGTVTTGADITFFSTLDATTAGAQNLALLSGAGTIFNGPVGATQALGALSFTTGSISATSSVSATSILQTGGASTLFSGPVTTTGSAGIDLTTTSLSFGNTVNAGLNPITLTADTLVLPTSTTGSIVTLRPLTASRSIGLESSAQQFNFTDAQFDSIAAVTLVLGSGTNTGGIRVGDDAAVSQNKNLVFETAGPVTIAGSLETTNGGGLTVTNGGVFTLSAPLTLSGSFTQNGTGLVNLGSNITTTAANIAFASPVTLGNTVTLDTTNDGTVTTGADVLLSSLDASTPGGQGLTLLAGSAGTASIAGSVGATNPLANLSIAAGAPLVQGAAWRVTGTTSLAVGTANDITLTNLANDFGTVAIASANNVSITDLNALNFGNTAVSGALTINAGGQISQSVETGITVAGNTTFATSLGEAGTVFLTNSAAAGTILGNSVVGGNFALTSAGNVSQVPDSTLKVAGTLIVNAPGSVSIINRGNVLSDSVSTNGDVTITRVGLITLPARTVSGNLIVESLASGEQFTEVLENSAILLDSATNSFGGAVGLSTANTLANITATPGITQSGTLVVSGQALFEATAAGDITLLDAANQFGSLGFTGNNVSIAQQNAVALLSSTAAGNLVLQSGSAITQSGSLAVGGSTSFTGTDILLDSEANALSGLVSFASSGNAVFVNIIDTQLGNAIVGGTLQVRSGTGLNLTGPLTASGVVLTGTSITSNSAGSVSAGSGIITFAADAITLGAPVSSGGTLSLQPRDPATTIGVAVPEGTLQLTADSLAQLQNGFSSIVIGSAAQTGDITVGAVAFRDPVSFQTPGGSLFVNGTLTGLDNASIELLSSANTTVLNADIVTAGNPIFFRSNVVLGNTVTLDTTSGDTVTTGANITFFSTLDATTAGAQDLALLSGAGTVFFNGPVGATQALGALSFTTGSINAASSVSATSILQTGGVSSSFSGPVTTTGSAGLDLTTTSLSFGNTVDAGPNPITFTADTLILGTSTTGSIVTLRPLTASRSIGLESSAQQFNFTDAQFDSIAAVTLVLGSGTNTGGIRVGDDGPVSQNKNLVFETAGPITIAGSLETTNGGSLTVTNGGLFTLSAPLSLAGSFNQNGTGLVNLGSNITTTTSNITFASPVTLTGPVTLDTTAPAGPFLPLDPFGNELPVSALGNISSASNLGGPQSLTARAGAGNLFFGGDVSVANMNLAGTDIDFNGPVSVGGAAVFDNSGLLSTSALLNVGSFAQTGAGPVSLGGNITATGGGIDFTGPVSIVANTVLSTVDGNVAFERTVDGPASLGIAAGNGSVSFLATVGGLSPLSGFAVESASQVTAADIRTFGAVGINTTGGIELGNLATTGGDLILNGNRIRVATIDTGSSNNPGGVVDITSQTTFQATGTITDLNGLTASISSAGTAGSAPITIRHLGGPFTVGDSSTNGTAGAITSRSTNTIAPVQIFPGSYTQDDIQILTVDPDPVPPLVEEDLPVFPPDRVPPPELVRFTTPSGPLPTLGATVLTLPQNLDQQSSADFADYFGFLGPDIFKKQLNTQEVQEILRRLARETGKRPAILYVDAFDRRLELALVTPDVDPVLRIVEVTRPALLAQVREFRDEVLAPSRRNSTTYLRPSRQLHSWVVGPIEPVLKEQGIDTLVFVLDRGLRHVPLAALHDGKQFLVEKYGLSLIPSVNLVDTRYVDVKKAQVLAMGASEFADDNQLPAVPLELSAVVREVGAGRFFLNKDFTLGNLKAQRQERPFGIIHLATHADFNTGPASSSYIKLTDARLGLNQLRELQWNDPPVELLVLSACRTAIGDENAELGFAGLAIAAGVKTAIASLWYASDEGTLGLMTQLYERLKGAPIKAEALRAAQLDMLTGQVSIQDGQLRTPRGATPLPDELKNVSNTSLAHPYYWSGFTMIGSPW